MLLTIKCLLIVPNPESALNEEAGKLLLERYDDYCARARLYTDIHAKLSESKATSTKTLSNSTVASSNIQHSSGIANSENSEHSANKKACNGVNGHENTVKKPISKKTVPIDHLNCFCAQKFENNRGMYIYIESRHISSLTHY